MEEYTMDAVSPTATTQNSTDYMDDTAGAPTSASSDIYGTDSYGYTGEDYYSTQTATPSADVDPAVVAAAAGFGLVFFIIWFAVIAVMITAMWKLFTKAGQPGWASIIPFYNAYVLLQIAGKPGWWLLLFFIPFVNIVIIFIVWYEISKAFGKDIGFALGLFFLSIIFLPILAFGSAVYHKREEFAPPAPVI